jgi:hypothetical protein
VKRWWHHVLTRRGWLRVTVCPVCAALVLAAGAQDHSEAMHRRHYWSNGYQQ